MKRIVSTCVALVLCFIVFAIPVRAAVGVDRNDAIDNLFELRAKYIAAGDSTKVS